MSVAFCVLLKYHHKIVEEKCVSLCLETTFYFVNLLILIVYLTMGKILPLLFGVIVLFTAPS